MLCDRVLAQKVNLRDRSSNARRSQQFNKPKNMSAERSETSRKVKQLQLGGTAGDFWPAAITEENLTRMDTDCVGPNANVWDKQHASLAGRTGHKHQSKCLTSNSSPRFTLDSTALNSITNCSLIVNHIGGAVVEHPSAKVP